MTQQQMILAGVVVVALILLIILIRAMTRRQTVTFDAVAPTPAPLARTIERPTPPPPAPVSPLIEGSPLVRLKGLGPKAATRLTELGVADVEALAALSDGEAAAIDAQMGAFQGRMAKDRWLDQAKLLATGDVAGFETQFGKLGG